MVNDLISEVVLVAMPGDRVRVMRPIPGDDSVGMEEFTDTINGVEIIFQDTKWCATYWFEEHDDEAKGFHIQERIGEVRELRLIPTPKYDFGDWLRFTYLGKTEHVERVKWIRLWLSRDEDDIKYHMDANDVDWCEETDVISKLVEEPNVDYKPIQEKES